MRRNSIAILAALCLAPFMVGGATLAAKYSPMMSFDQYVREMDYALLRLANNDPSLDLKAIEQELVFARSATLSFDVRVAQCRWMVGVEMLSPGRYDLQAVATYWEEARIFSADHREFTRILRMVADGQISPESGFQLLTDFLVRVRTKRL